MARRETLEAFPEFPGEIELGRCGLRIRSDFPLEFDLLGRDVGLGLKVTDEVEQTKLLGGADRLASKVCREADSDRIGIRGK